MNEERDKIMEKRSSLRSWRERGKRMPQNQLVGTALAAAIFLAVAASAFMGSN